MSDYECYCRCMDETDDGAHITEHVENVWFIGQDDDGATVMRVYDHDGSVHMLYIDFCPFCGRPV